jgi:hypothetical protein
VSSLIDASVTRATPHGDSALPLAGGPLDARLPLALLEAVRAIDKPEAELDAELVHELRNKRLGLSETVLLQIRRYQEAVRRQQRVPFDARGHLDDWLDHAWRSDFVARTAGTTDRAASIAPTVQTIHGRDTGATREYVDVGRHGASFRGCGTARRGMRLVRSGVPRGTPHTRGCRWRRGTRPLPLARRCSVPMARRVASPLITLVSFRTNDAHG